MSPRIGEVDTAIGLNDDVIGSIETPALEAVGEHRQTTIELDSRDASSIVLTCQQPALKVTRQPVGPIGALELQRHALAWSVSVASTVMDVAEQKIATLLPPDGALGGTE